MFRSHLRKSRRFVLITALVVAAALVFAAAAYAVGSNISPESQGAQGGDVVSWNATWSGTAPFNVTFSYGDGTSTTLPPRNTRSYTFTHQFYPCYETTYTQKLKVTDGLGLVSTTTAQTIVNPGNIC